MSPTVYGAHGARFTIDVADTALGDRVAAAFRTLAVEEGEPEGAYRIFPRGEDLVVLTYQDEEIGARYSPDALLLLLHWHINQLVIRAATERCTTFHAAAARSPHGTGILLPAPMESGKTTTVTGLLRAGWDFLTDEAAAVEPDGTVWAYPKPLTIDEGSWALFPDLAPGGATRNSGSWLVPAPETGASVVPFAAVRLIVFPGYREGAATELQAMTPSEAALELARSTFRFDENGARDLRCVSGLARRIPAYRLAIGDLDEAVAAIQRLDVEQVSAA